MSFSARRSRTEKADGVEWHAKRINVAVTPETVRALELVVERDNVTLSEAVRRLIGYGDFIYHAIREQRAEVLVKASGSAREVVLL